MTDQRMITLTTFSNPIEAELARNHLEDEGIRAFLSGETTSNMFAGSFAVTVALQVAEADADKALELLAEFGPRDRRREFLADAAQAGPSRAEGSEEGDTAIRVPEWASAEEPDEDDPESRYRTTAAEFQPAKRPVHEERFKASGPEPTAPITEKPVEPEEAQEPPRVTWGPDDYANRAFKAAILGPIVCLGMLNFYSAYLLLRLLFVEEEVSAAGMKKVYAALAIDAAVILTLILFVMSVSR